MKEVYTWYVYVMFDKLNSFTFDKLNNFIIVDGGRGSSVNLPEAHKTLFMALIVIYQVSVALFSDYFLQGYDMTSSCRN
jgi:hypothetical protein